METKFCILNKVLKMSKCQILQNRQENPTNIFTTKSNQVYEMCEKRITRVKCFSRGSDEDYL